MSTNELEQYVVFTVVAFGLYWLFVIAPRARIREPAAWSQKRGLRFMPPVDFLGSSRQGTEVCTFAGAANQVGFEMRSARLVNTRHAGVNGSTEIVLRAAVRAAVPAPVAFSVELTAGPSVQAPDAVTGLVRAHSDNVPAACAWLAGSPALKAAIVQALADGAPIRVSYAHGELRVALSTPIWQEPQLDRVLALVAAVGHAHLA